MEKMLDSGKRFRVLSMEAANRDRTSPAINSEAERQWLQARADRFSRRAGSVIKWMDETHEAIRIAKQSFKQGQEKIDTALPSKIAD